MRILKYFLLIVLCSLAAIELVLRLAGVVLLSDQLLSGKHTLGNKTILTLGESTTAKLSFSPNLSWPEQLEMMSSRVGGHFRIVNVAEPGTNSLFIAKKLPEQIESYHPDIVISMVGINDTDRNEMARENFLQKESFLKNMRIVKLFRFCSRLMRNYFYETQSNIDSIRVEIQPSIIAALQNKNIGLAKNLIEKQIYSLSFNGRAIFFNNLLLEFSLHAFGLSNEEKIELFRPAISSCYLIRESVWYLSWLASVTKHQDLCEEIVASYVQSKNVPDGSTILYLNKCLSKKSWAYKPFTRLVSQLVSEEELEKSNVKMNYQIIYDLLSKHKICWIVMSYPFRDIASVREYFSPEQISNMRLKFVENKENFLDAKRVHSYSDLFADRFAIDFGHATALGNSLIASAAQKALDELLSTEDCHYSQW